MRVGITSATFWNMTFAEFEMCIEAYGLTVKDRALESLQSAMYVAQMQSTKARQFYKQEYRRLTKTAEPVLTAEQLRERHERIVAQLGNVITIG